MTTNNQTEHIRHAAQEAINRILSAKPKDLVSESLRMHQARAMKTLSEIGRDALPLILEVLHQPEAYSQQAGLLLGACGSAIVAGELSVALRERKEDSPELATHNEAFRGILSWAESLLLGEQFEGLSARLLAAAVLGHDLPSDVSIRLKYFEASKAAAMDALFGVLHLGLAARSRTTIAASIDGLVCLAKYSHRAQVLQTLQDFEAQVSVSPEPISSCLKSALKNIRNGRFLPYHW